MLPSPFSFSEPIPFGRSFVSPVRMMSYDKLAHILDLIKIHLPKIENIYTKGHVTNLNNKTVDEMNKFAKTFVNPAFLSFDGRKKARLYGI